MIDGLLWVLSILQLPEGRGCSLLFLENRKAPGGFLDPGDRRLLLQEHQQGDICFGDFCQQQLSLLCSLVIVIITSTTILMATSILYVTVTMF